MAKGCGDRLQSREQSSGGDEQDIQPRSLSDQSGRLYLGGGRSPMFFPTRVKADILGEIITFLREVAIFLLASPRPLTNINIGRTPTLINISIPHVVSNAIDPLLPRRLRIRDMCRTTTRCPSHKCSVSRSRMTKSAGTTSSAAATCIEDEYCIADTAEGVPYDTGIGKMC